MIVYDVVQVIRPGTRCSTEPGRWLARTFSRVGEALSFADRANRCATVPGITYVVECQDEGSPARAIAYRDRPRADRTLPTTAPGANVH